MTRTSRFLTDMANVSQHTVALLRSKISGHAERPNGPPTGTGTPRTPSEDETKGATARTAHLRFQV
jgi:hypothetical protein